MATCLNLICKLKKSTRLFCSVSIKQPNGNCGYSSDVGSYEPYDNQNERRSSVRSIPLNSELHEVLMHSKPDNPPISKLTQVSILGLPNAGKSTLANQIMKWKICTVSKKVHTTRKNCRAILVEDDTQIVFLDTPGLIGKKEMQRHKLEKSLLVDPENSLIDSNLLLYVHDVSCKRTRWKIDPKVLKLLYKYQEKEAVLVLNKIDLIRDKLRILDLTDELTEGVVGGIESNKSTRLTLKRKKRSEVDKEELFKKMEDEKEKSVAGIKRLEEAVDHKNLSDDELFERVKDLKGWRNFSSVFMVSALEDDGVDDLREYLVKSAKPSPWRYSSSLVTDIDPKEIVLQTVKEKLLDHLPMELPYVISPRIEFWDVSPSGLLSLVLSLRPKSKHWVKLIVGSGGARIKQISQEAEQDLRNTFRYDVRLKIIVEDPKSK
ncbi:GTPase Era, mitochondrial-like [Artemia franciscana]